MTEGKSGEKVLCGEIEALREALAAAISGIRMAESSADVARTGGVVARLCDSLVRARLAEQKLGAGRDYLDEVRESFERRLREIGRGEGQGG